MLDATDKKLLNLLQRDASLTHKQIAAELNLTVTPVYERIKKLRSAGIIKGEHVKIDRKRINKPLLVFCEVSVKDHKKENLEKFEREVMSLKEVIECYHVSGNNDYMLKVVESSMEDYRDFLINKLAKITNVSNVNSAFVMHDLKEDGFIEL
ncbi:MAG: Lrp/AsnC family transcriptional regulator [Crocinitomicaceae bacterium]